MAWPYGSPLPGELRSSLKVLTPPDFDPAAAATCIITLDDAKRQCHVDFSDDDEILRGILRAVFSHLDGVNGILGRALLPQQWEMRLDRFPFGALRGVIRIPLPPIVTLDSIKYVDSDGMLQTLDSSAYQLVENGDQPAFVVPAFGKCWPATRCEHDAVRVTFTAGYADGTAIPDALKHAARILTAHWYENRELAILPIRGVLLNVPKSADALLAPYIASWF